MNPQVEAEARLAFEKWHEQTYPGWSFDKHGDELAKDHPMRGWYVSNVVQDRWTGYLAASQVPKDVGEVVQVEGFVHKREAGQFEEPFYSFYASNASEHQKLARLYTPEIQFLKAQIRKPVQAPVAEGEEKL